MKRRMIALAMALVMVLCLVPTVAMAAGTTAQVAISACTKIGENDYGDVYYYTTALPADTTEVEFTDLADKMEEGMIASLENPYVEGTNKVPVSSSYAVSVNADELDEWSFDEGYSAEDFADDYAYWITDDDYDMYFVILRKEPIANSDPFTASAGTVTDLVEDGYVYSGFVYAPDNPAADKYGYIYPESKAALYTLTVPYGTSSVKLDFGTEQRLVYHYDAYGTYISGEYDDPTVGETTATVSVDSNKDGIPDYIWVQNPYNADNSGGELLYVIKLVYSYTFTASVNNEELAITSSAENAYTYTDWNDAVHVMNLYILTIPGETESVALTFSNPVLAYNYGGSNVTDSDYIAGAVEEYMVGKTAFTVNVDANNDGALDYVQIQTPYFDGWSSDCLYAITFRYANAGAGGGSGTENIGAAISDAYAATKKLLSDRMSGYAWKGGTSNSDDWDVFGLARDGVSIPKSYYESAVAAVQEKKLTGDARSILTLMAAGYDPAKVNGTDLMKALADQVDAADSNCGFGAWGIYSIPWVLITLNNDRTDYATQCNALMNWLVNNQKKSGAWGYQSDDVDLTAEAISALAPYYTTNSNVKAAIDKALTWLAAQQEKNGSFHYNGAPSVESTSQVIVALTALGIDPANWNGKDAVSAMCTMALPTGGFTYGNSYNEISTYEGFYALVAYYRYLSGKTSLYDMSDMWWREKTADASGNIGNVASFTDAAVKVDLGSGKAAAMDKALVTALKAKTGNVNLKINNELSDLNDAQKAVVGSKKVVNIDLSVGDVAIEGALAGKLTVTIPADTNTTKTNGYRLVAKRVDNDGSLTDVTCYYDSNGNIVLVLDHLSTYMIYTEAVNSGYHGYHGYDTTGAQTVTTDLTAGSITKVTVDGKVVDSKNYTISGSNVTFTAAYLKTLANGKHAVAIENATHVAKATITVENGTTAVNPAKTGDMGVVIYFAMGAMSYIGSAALLRKRKDEM